jgi:MFS transporter, NNP family, nitrate/nitrite transporter
MMGETFRPGAGRALFLSTTAFAVSFAVWGLLSALAPTFRQEYRLTAVQTSVMIAGPVLVGSLGRLVAGLLADRFGGRLVFAGLLVVGALPAIAIGFADEYTQFVAVGLALGVAGTTFPVGTGFASKWFPPEKQGFALGVYGMGNFGQSIAVFGVPVLAAALGSWRPVCFAFAALSAIWAVLFYLLARDAAAGTPKPLGEMIGVLGRSPMAWVLSLFYFLTFGGFVAMSVYLPTLLRDVFGLSPTDAGARTAGFVILATIARPAGGVLSDRFGGARVLVPVFGALALLALLMAAGGMPLFTVGALGGALALGAGNGAVFKLVPQHFAKETATVTGLVGAFGGLGGFFPPLALGVIRDATGSYALGFLLLAAFAAVCLAVLYAVFLRGGSAPAPRT